MPRKACKNAPFSSPFSPLLPSRPLGQSALHQTERYGNQILHHTAVETVQIKIAPMPLVHVKSRLHPLIPFAQLRRPLRWQLHSHARFGHIELYEQKPFATYAKHNPLPRKKFLRHALVQPERIQSHVFYIHNRISIYSFPLSFPSVSAIALPAAATRLLPCTKTKFGISARSAHLSATRRLHCTKTTFDISARSTHLPATRRLPCPPPDLSRSVFPAQKPKPRRIHSEIGVRKHYALHADFIFRAYGFSTPPPPPPCSLALTTSSCGAKSRVFTSKASRIAVLLVN